MIQILPFENNTQWLRYLSLIVKKLGKSGFLQKKKKGGMLLMRIFRTFAMFSCRGLALR